MESTLLWRYQLLSNDTLSSKAKVQSMRYSKNIAILLPFSFEVEKVPSCAIY